MSYDRTSAAAPAPLWVFGYGSLMWQPDFPVAERVVARASGWRRSFCMWSIHHRGSPEEPGLVLALDRDPSAACLGVALRVETGAEDDTLAMLRERELISSAYLEVSCPVEAMDGRALQTLAYVIDRAHVQYTGRLDLAAQAQIIARARGGRGPNHEYLTATVAQLEALGIADAELSDLAAEVRRLLGC